MANTSKLSAENGETFVFVNNLPDNYHGPILAGAVCYSARSSHSELVLQELQGDKYGIRLLAGKFLKNIYAKGWMHTEGLYSTLMLKNSMRKKIASLGETHVMEGQYSCFYTQPSDCCSFFEEGKEFCLFDLFCSPLLLEELVPAFPKLQSVVGTDPGALITQKPFWLPVAIREIINEILQCRFDETARRFYFDTKVKELLLCMLENAFKQDAGKLSFTRWEIGRIHEARKILREHISSKPPSIRELARLVALNEYKLKKGFHQYFHTSIGQWMQEEKLQYSRELLLNTNKPIKEISHLVGYPLTTNFITAFRKHFGFTPGDLRRK